MVSPRQASGQRHYGQKREIVCQEEESMIISSMTIVRGEKIHMAKISPVSCVPGLYFERLGDLRLQYPPFPVRQIAVMETEPHRKRLRFLSAV
jgi:hypothetical protein